MFVPDAQVSKAILVTKLVKSYGPVKALRGVNLEIAYGEIFGFLGPNGAGKTTTIRCLLDLIHPDSGQIQVLGINPQKDPVSIHQRVGYLPGELHLEENLSVEAALRYLSRLRATGKQTPVEWDYVRQLAERLDLNLKTLVRNLSKGNKQKVGVIQAVMHRPELLLLDEPTTGLDPLMQREVLRLISEAQVQGATVLFSSHILSEVQEIAQRVGIIRQGMVVEVAEKAVLIQRALRRVHIRFGEPISPDAFQDLVGVKLLSQDDGWNLHFQVEGEMDGLIKRLARYPVIDFVTEQPSLEEIFLAYYEKDTIGG